MIKNYEEVKVSVTRGKNNVVQTSIVLFSSLAFNGFNEVNLHTFARLYTYFTCHILNTMEIENMLDK